MKAIALLFLSLLLTTQPSSGYDRITGKPFASRSRIIARHGMVATSQPLATQVALDILKQGGNAVDAAIAANAMLGLVEPTGNGIGGDLFAIIWDSKTEKLYGLNASGRSPYLLNPEHFQSLQLKYIPPHGPLPITVPGCVDGWFELHKRFGSLPMKTILEPAIMYAREGFPVSDLIAYYWQKSVPILQKYEGFKKTFMPAPKGGTIFQNPDLAKTLEMIAEKGRDVFYKGEIAEAIDVFMKKVGGFLTCRDLADHTSEWVEPVSTNYRGHDVWELPPNGQGIAALQILNILEGYNIRSMQFGSLEYFFEISWLTGISLNSGSA